MGNAPSSQNASTPNNSANPASTSSSQPAPISTTVPIPNPPTASSSTFHSGLTPPPRSPSPPCPSTPPLLPYGGHLSPQNPHALALTQARDYSKSVVTSLILEARLAPFYRGLEDYEEDFTEEDLGRILTELKEKDFDENVPNSVVEAMKAEREASHATVKKKIGIHRGKESRLEEEKIERDKRERRAYIGAVECPICFLNYPSNINTSRCCQQPICTECFVQIKRSEPTLTHLESEPACCPFCVETDFGVIYERPTLPASSAELDSALSISPEAGTSGLSQALSLNSDDAALNVGIGMAPKAQETMRRKSVSHTSKEVVTIDEIRPDWETKLNAVKAAAARKASRRIVMRQVGDRLVPIGFTSARTPGTADFSMSVGQTDSNRERRGSRRERDLEELMIMEAMRLSLLDHEEHQRTAQPGSTERADKRKFSLSVPGQSSGSSSRRASESKHERGGSTASKLFSKITNSGNRSRSASTASSLKTVSFSPSTTNLAGPSRSPAPPSPVRPPSSLSPTATTPAVTTLADHTAVQGASSAPSPQPVDLPTPVGESSSELPGLPRLSLDMEPLAPTAAERQPLHRNNTDISEAPTERPSYARLDSSD